jgi:hypothetical protein
MCKRFIVILLAAPLLVMATRAPMVPFSAMAQEVEAGAEVESATGLWKFTLTETGTSASPDSITFNVDLTQYGSLVFGSAMTDLWVGKTEGDKLSMTIFSQPAKGEQVSQGLTALSGAFELRKDFPLFRRSASDGTTSALGAWKGEGYFITPSDQNQPVFQTFIVAAKKLSPDSGEQPMSIDWCGLFHLDDIWHDCYSDIPVNEMASCHLDKNGDGYYLYGSRGPGADHWGTSAIARATIYFPYRLRACGSREYHFTISAGDKYETADQLIQSLKANPDFLIWAGIDPDEAATILTDIYNQYGDFALSVGYNTHTSSVNVYISTAGSSSSGICEAVQNSSVLSRIKQKLDKGGGVFVKCGGSFTDKDTLKYHWDPTHCARPMLFIYVFGTIAVNYD